MHFVYPAYLFGLFLVLIPVLIHLFKLRKYKTVYFSNIRFLKEVHQTYRNTSRLKDLILLLIRMLLIIFLVLAFAQPHTKNQSQPPLATKGLVGVFIDPSQSMSNPVLEGTAFDLAKQTALQQIRSYPLNTGFVVFDPTDPASFRRQIDKTEAQTKVGELRLTHQAWFLGDILQRVELVENLNTEETEWASLNIFSDFRKNFIEGSAFPDSLSAPYSLYPIESTQQNNLYFDTCWLREPMHHYGSKIHISGMIVNDGVQPYDQLPVSLFINDSLSAKVSISLEPGERKEFSVSYLPVRQGIQTGEFRINDYPMDFDNSFFFTFSLNPQTRIAHLYNNIPDEHIAAVFYDDPVFDYSEYPINAVPVNDFSGFETLIITGANELPKGLSELLITFLEAGGNLLIFPPAKDNPQGLNIFLRSIKAPTYADLLVNEDIAQFSTEMKDFYSEISLNPETTVNWPTIAKHFRLNGSGQVISPVLTGRTGRSVLISMKYGKGLLGLSTFPLDKEFSSLTDHPLFIPIIYYLSTAELRNSNIFLRLGSSEPYRMRIGQTYAKPIEIIEPVTGFKTIPQQEVIPNEPYLRVFLNEWKGKPGIIYLHSDERVEGAVAMNYPSGESKMDYYGDEELEQFAKEKGMEIIRREAADPGGDITSDSTATPVKVSASRLLLLLSLLMLIAETLVFRIKS